MCPNWNSGKWAVTSKIETSKNNERSRSRSVVTSKATANVKISVFMTYNTLDLYTMAATSSCDCNLKLLSSNLRSLPYWVCLLTDDAAWLGQCKFYIVCICYISECHDEIHCREIPKFETAAECSSIWQQPQFPSWRNSESYAGLSTATATAHCTPHSTTSDSLVRLGTELRFLEQCWLALVAFPPTSPSCVNRISQ